MNETITAIRQQFDVIAKKHNIKEYSIEIILWQDGTEQATLVSHNEDYKITITLK